MELTWVPSGMRVRLLAAGLPGIFRGYGQRTPISWQRSQGRFSVYCLTYAPRCPTTFAFYVLPRHGPNVL